MTPEQVRRSGDPATAVDLCRDALARFPDHLSSRVTLGWALLDLGRLNEAREELLAVRRAAPDNFAAVRGLAQLHVLDDGDLEDLAHAAERPKGAPAPASQISPVVTRLEAWLSRIEALRAAV